MLSVLLTCHLEQDDARAVGVKEVGAPQLPREGREQRGKEGDSDAGP